MKPKSNILGQRAAKEIQNKQIISLWRDIWKLPHIHRHLNGKHTECTRRAAEGQWNKPRMLS